MLRELGFDSEVHVIRRYPSGSALKANVALFQPRSFDELELHELGARAAYLLVPGTAFGAFRTAQPMEIHDIEWPGLFVTRSVVVKAAGHGCQVAVGRPCNVSIGAAGKKHDELFRDRDLVPFVA